MGGAPLRPKNINAKTFCFFLNYSYLCSVFRKRHQLLLYFSVELPPRKEKERANYIPMEYAFQAQASHRDIGLW